MYPMRYSYLNVMEHLVFGITNRRKLLEDTSRQSRHVLHVIVRIYAAMLVRACLAPDQIVRRLCLFGAVRKSGRRHEAKMAPGDKDAKLALARAAALEARDARVNNCDERSGLLMQQQVKLKARSLSSVCVSMCA